MSSRIGLLFVMCAACATASRPQASATGDDAGPDASSPDASRLDASPAPARDAAAQPDAPPPPPDAPASACAYSGVLATWNLAGEPGSQISTAAASTAPGVTATTLQRSAGLTAVTGSGSINASNWTTSAQLDPTRYYTLAFTPPAGCTASLTTVALDLKASTTGPASAAVATSDDGFARTVAAPPSATSTSTLAVTNVTGTLEIRIYGYGATGASGTMRVQNTLQVSGTLQ